MVGKKELIAAPVTIFNQCNQINEYEMDQLLKKILREGADGLFVGGSVGNASFCQQKKESECLNLLPDT